MPVPLALDAALRRFDARAAGAVSTGRRLLLGLTGAPGAGKSTLAARLVARARATHGAGAAVVVPMDGFHLANAILVERDVRDRKGAPETFDDAGFAALLARLHRSSPGTTVYAPRFDRDLDESVGSAIPVPAACAVVVVEGNYLLADDGAWPLARAHLDEVWHLRLPDDVRRHRLIDRHVAHGLAPDAARDWALGPDEANAARIEADADRADVVVTVD
ncbi:nucleoside/nucleotide kinase family protein [Tersicoccus solisilvae]|uniref:Nucleoside/nucleotide kinase family protein n=1 Tax=Tersicoccus solisilvae TaxID=1882339 RepID=A0ABQ1NQV0_9MICC|nr:nucleoside/nucleotide kinase family protein [Tersicoccus solisilvae]GGC80265.1 nucleoside/nucleotide kinase family protein [Tersicoccus solisilvae]